MDANAAREFKFFLSVPFTASSGKPPQWAHSPNCRRSCPGRGGKTPLLRQVQHVRVISVIKREVRVASVGCVVSRWYMWQIPSFRDPLASSICHPSQSRHSRDPCCFHKAVSPCEIGVHSVHRFNSLCVHCVVGVCHIHMFIQCWRKHCLDSCVVSGDSMNHLLAMRPF